MFTVRIATSDLERENAFSVRRKVFVGEQGVPLNLELDDLDETATHFIVYSSETPVGAGRLRVTVDGIGKVERICILEEYRGKHLGNLIMQTLEEHAKETGMSKIILNAKTHAVPFYEKLGYVITSPEFMDADIPHRAMEKNIFRQ